MDRLFWKPRAHKLEDLVARVPGKMGAEKERVARLKAEAEERKKARDANTSPSVLLHITVASAKDLAVKDKSGASDPYVVLRVADIEHKTPVAPKTLAPTWNDHFAFDLTGVDVDFEELLVEMWDKDKVGTDDFMGCVRMRVIDALHYAIDEKAHDGKKFILQRRPENDREEVI